jgi:hypothetical protein
MSDAKVNFEEVGHIARILAANEDMAMLEGFTAKRPSVTERLAFGKSVRNSVLRADHAHKAHHRADTVEILEKQNAFRVQKLVLVRLPACSPRLSPLCAGRRRSWRGTLPTRRSPAGRSMPPVICTSPILASMPRSGAISPSPSTISTRPIRRHGNGTSNA